MASTITPEIHQGEHFKAIHAGPLSGLARYAFNLPILPAPVSGKLFLKDILGLSGMEVSVNRLPAGTSVPFWHRHKENEELYFFIGGKGQFMVDDACIDVSEGSAILVQPEAKRTWRSLGEDDLYFLVIQAKKDSLSQHTLEDGIALKEPVNWSEMQGKEVSGIK